jgi:hypothetical protein
MPIDIYEGLRPKCRPSIKITDTGSFSTYEKLCYVINLLKEVVEVTNGFSGDIEHLEKTKEDSDNITLARQLSPTGNFTGSLDGRKVKNVLMQTDSNRDTINYLTTQFSDGQTGFVIDGGFFEDEGIDKNYDGGIF